jgi:riboflavin synthase
MFTGLVETVGTIHARELQAFGLRLQIAAPWPDQERTAIGDSVAVNGCCLTVVAIAQAGVAEALTFELSHETLARTAFAALQPGDPVNLERALRVGDRLGGHLVTGHVDGLATLEHVTERDGCWDLRYRLPDALLPEVADKGSVAIDGISLTVNGTDDGVLVTIIPHTAAHTQVLYGGAGKRVHVETDLIAKHVRRLAEFLPFAAK